MVSGEMSPRGDRAGLADRYMLVRVSLAARTSVLRDDPAREHSPSHRWAEAIRTHDGILNTATIDAARNQRGTAGGDVQVADGFAHQQPTTALAVHSPSFCRTIPHDLRFLHATLLSWKAGCFLIIDQRKVTLEQTDD